MILRANIFCITRIIRDSFLSRNLSHYASWSRAIKFALSIKNKLGFIDGSISKPSVTDPILLQAWMRKNNIVISWLLNSVSKEISASILFADSAVEIWDDLHDRFQQSNGPRIFQLRRELFTLRQEQDPVTVYFTKIKALWEELNQFRPMCSCGKCVCDGVKKIEAYTQMDYTMLFLMGLNDSFAQVRSQHLAKSDTSSPTQDGTCNASPSVHNSRVTLPNHEHAEFKYCGDIKLGSILLLDVLYIPEFKFNLLSVSSLIADTQSTVSFYHDSFIIQDNISKRMIGKGKKIDGLYILEVASSSSSIPINHVDIQVWHNLLGHPSLKILQSLRSMLQLNIEDLHSATPCTVCPLAKQKLLPFVSHHHVSLDAFDLVHCDTYLNSSSLPGLDPGVGEAFGSHSGVVPEFYGHQHQMADDGRRVSSYPVSG
ncbi:uncharacterized protein [Henckelia pumila]|uniref:uncharacterized protein n=1 Tax=Henckelia pumila TaxID=405737 RepID=UPI003C6DC110